MLALVQMFELGCWTMTDQTSETPSLLASEISKRLMQLLISRRALAQASGLSRQTLHAIEREGHTNLSPATCEALDRALRWPSGTTYKLSQGDTAALASLQQPSAKEQAAIRRKQLVDLVLSFSDSELETFALFIEIKWAQHQRALVESDAL